MKKKRKEMLKNIKKEKKRLEKNLDTFLIGLQDDEREGYEPFENLLEVLEDVNFKTMQTECLPMSDWTIIPELKMDSTRKVCIALSILYSFIVYKIFEENKSGKVKGIPDELMNEITDFKGMLEDFLFF